MSDVEEEDLRTTSDAILAETGKLRDLEEKKRKLSADDEERIRLSDKIAEVGKRVERATVAESELARHAADD